MTTLDKLRAMNDDQLFSHWGRANYPFDRANCHTCMTGHVCLGYCAGHQEIIDAMLGLHSPGYYESANIVEFIKAHLEELIAIRMFHRDKYPLPVPVEDEVAQPVVVEQLVTQ